MNQGILPSKTAGYMVSTYRTGIHVNYEYSTSVQPKSFKSNSKQNNFLCVGYHEITEALFTGSHCVDRH